jgi:hypothetical protein
MKKTTNLAQGALSILALALLFGCDSVPEGRHPKSTQECVFVVGQPAPDVSIEVENAVHVVLPGPDPASGMVWEMASNNNKVLEQMGPFVAQSGGGASTTSVSFYSLKLGKSILRFVLVHPNQPETVPAAMCELTVRVVDRS